MLFRSQLLVVLAPHLMPLIDPHPVVKPAVVPPVVPGTAPEVVATQPKPVATAPLRACGG